jgi:RNA polymerase sigma factor (sigma-70 family)
VEVSTLRYSGGIGLHGRSPLLRLQSDERLVAYVRRGSPAAFEVLVSRYQSRLLAFCRHLLSSREDAEDVLQEVLAAAFNAIIADERPINVRPWLYRIARNRSLNHLRRTQAVGVDSMDVHLSDHGATTADKVHEREDFRMLVGDIHGLPETQRTALVLREMDALSYEQIAEAMETTVPSVKSLLVRARVSLAEAAEARMLSCAEVRIQLGEVAEGLSRRPGTLVRRHLRSCKRCSSFQMQLKQTNKALTAMLPIGPLVLLRKLLITHLGHSAGAGSGATGAGAAGQAAAVGSTAAAGAGAVGSAGGIVTAGIGAIATKAAAGLAAAALVTAGAVEVTHVTHPTVPRGLAVVQSPLHLALEAPKPVPAAHYRPALARTPAARRVHHKHRVAVKKAVAATDAKPIVKPASKPTDKAALRRIKDPSSLKGHTQTQTDPTVLSTPTSSGSTPPAAPGAGDPSTTPATTTATPTTTSTTPTGNPPTSCPTTPPPSDPPTTTTPTAPEPGPAACCPTSSTTATSCPADTPPNSGTTTTTDQTPTAPTSATVIGP